MHNAQQISKIRKKAKLAAKIKPRAR